MLPSAALVSWDRICVYEACHDDNARRSLEQLPNLRGCQVHTSVMLSEVDIKIYKKLGMDLTSEPVQTARKKY